MREGLTNTDFLAVSSKKSGSSDTAPDRYKTDTIVHCLRDRNLLQCGQAHYALYLRPHGGGDLVV